jgi:hypothetical protein
MVQVVAEFRGWNVVPRKPKTENASREDGRIPPWQPAKMLARLQEVSCSPAILRIERKGGHGLGLTRDQENAEKADLFAFAWWAALWPVRAAIFRTLQKPEGAALVLFHQLECLTP